MSQLIVDTARIVDEANASYNAKYKTDVTFQGVASKIQKWYLTQDNFPRFTDNLLLKSHSINNCGLVLNSEDVYVLDKVNNGFAQFKLFDKDTTVVCSIKDTSNFIDGKSDNIKVADSLPQSGDFAGQICSLTTGATYVWTGSEWSSTAGSSTLPTPTSANKWYGLVSTGSAWEANRSVYGRKAQLTNVAANAVVYYPLFKMSGQEGVAHGAISGQFGIHNNASFQIFVDVTLWGGTTSMGVLTVLKSYARSNSTVAYNSLSLKIGSDKTVYLRMQGVSSSSEGAVYTINKFIGDVDTVEPSSPTPFIVADESQYSDLTSYEKHTPVPVSTAEHQMLVSDGNGGWSTYYPDLSFKRYSNNGSFISTTEKRYYPIAESVLSNNTDLCHLAFSVQWGGHGETSMQRRIEIVAKNADITAGVLTLGCVESINPGTSVGGGVYYDVSDWLTVFGLAYQYSTSTHTVTWYITAKSGGYTWPVPRFTITDVIVDNHTTFYQQKTDLTAISDLSGATDITATKLTPVPICSATDNGKVLKVVSGVPTWSAS